MKTITFTAEQLDMLKNVISFIQDQLSWDLDGFTDADDNTIFKPSILFYKKEMDFELFKKLYLRLFEK